MNSIHGILESHEICSLAQQSALCIARLAPITLLTPVFGGQAVSARFRFSASIIFGVSLALSLHQPNQTSLVLVKLLIRLLQELVLGMILGLLVLAILKTATAFGAMVDLYRADQIPATFDPHFQKSETMLSSFFTHVAIVLFVMIGGHRMVLETMHDGFLAFPPMSSWSQAMAGIRHPIETTVTAASAVVPIAFRIAWPILILTLLLDLALALSSRISHPLDVTMIAFSMKGVLVLAVLFLAICSCSQGFIDYLAFALSIFKKAACGQ